MMVTLWRVYNGKGQVIQGKLSAVSVEFWGFPITRILWHPFDPKDRNYLFLFLVKLFAAYLKPFETPMHSRWEANEIGQALVSTTEYSLSLLGFGVYTLMLCVHWYIAHVICSFEPKSHIYCTFPHPYILSDTCSVFHCTISKPEFGS